MFREKTHPDRAKRIDFAACGAAKGASKIARANYPTNRCREKSGSLVRHLPKALWREAKPDRNGMISARLGSWNSKLALLFRIRAPRDFRTFEQVSPFDDCARTKRNEKRAGQLHSRKFCWKLIASNWTRAGTTRIGLGGRLGCRSLPERSPPTCKHRHGADFSPQHEFHLPFQCLCVTLSGGFGADRRSTGGAFSLFDESECHARSADSV
jgi:hypothetical protein